MVSIREVGPEEIDLAARLAVLEDEVFEAPPVAVLFFGTLFPVQGLKAMFFIKAVTVAPTHQGRGIGTALIRHLCALALERDIVRIDWSAMVDNDGAMRL